MSNCIPHGWMACDRCWKGTAKSQESGLFRLVRDPGHAGASNPLVLVLGISKGNTQSDAYARGSPVEEVAFKGMRPRLFQVLQAVGLLPGETYAHFDPCRFTRNEREYAFASVVRCSLTKLHRDKHTAESKYVISAFKPHSAGYDFVSACVEQHIGHLPPATRTVILLGNSDSYIKSLRDLIRRTMGHISTINDVAYRAGEVTFVHVSHPSGGNGNFNPFIEGKGKAGEKKRLASAALR